MKSHNISKPYFPSRKLGARVELVQDAVFESFERQAEQLTGYDQSYLQLTAGAFRGRFLSAHLDDSLSVHLEYCNQGLEQEVAGRPDCYCFGLVLAESTGFCASGVSMGMDDLLLLPPGSDFHLLSPVDGAVMAISVNREALALYRPLLARTVDWLQGLPTRPHVLHEPALASHLRTDVQLALETAGQEHTAVCGQELARALLGSLLSTLAVRVAGEPAAKRAAPVSYQRFVHCRQLLDLADEAAWSTDNLASLTATSKRSVEASFTHTVAMGPLSYLRLRRLHRVRAELLDPGNAAQSIGDLAARHGFWDWSHFTGHYRRLFGESPSQTRLRVAK